MSSNKRNPLKDTRAEPAGREVNPWLALAQGIVYRAILDWKLLDTDQVVPSTNYASLRSFFESPWCENLLLFTDIDPEMIIISLEKHTQEVSR